jgi:hypothetical protein
MDYKEKTNHKGRANGSHVDHQKENKKIDISFYEKNKKVLK